MYSIIDIATNKLVIASIFNNVEDGHIAIEQVCMIENSEGKDIFYDFENEIFYLNQ